MTNEPTHVDEYNLEDDHVQPDHQLLHLRHRGPHSGIELGVRRHRVDGTIGLFVDTEDRVDAERLFEALHVPGTDYTARWSLIESDDRRIFVLRLATPTCSMVSIAGPRSDSLDRAFRRAVNVAVTPKRNGTIDMARSVTIDNNREFWDVAIGRVR